MTSTPHAYPPHLAPGSPHRPSFGNASQSPSGGASSTGHGDAAVTGPGTGVAPSGSSRVQTSADAYAYPHVGAAGYETYGARVETSNEGGPGGIGNGRDARTRSKDYNVGMDEKSSLNAPVPGSGGRRWDDLLESGEADPRKSGATTTTTHEHSALGLGTATDEEAGSASTPHAPHDSATAGAGAGAVGAGVAGTMTLNELGTSTKKMHLSALAFSKTQLWFLALYLLQTIIVLLCIIVIFTKVQAEIMHSNSRLRTITVYLAVFIVANLFSILMAFDALRERNTVQIIGLVIFNLMMMVYGAILPSQIKEAVRNPGGSISLNQSGNNCNYYMSCYGLTGLYDDIEGWVITIPVVTGVCILASCWFTWLLFKEFGWAVFKQIGADITLKRIYGYFQVFSVLLKFDFFFFVGYSIQFLILVSGVSDTEESLTIAAAPISLAVIVLAAVGVRKEIHGLMVIFTIFWLGALVYFIYKLVKTYQDPNGAFSVAQKSLTLFSCLSILTLIATGVLALTCWRNFGKGMRDQHVWSTFVWCTGKSRPRMERQPSRMSLD